MQIVEHLRQGEGYSVSWRVLLTYDNIYVGRPSEITYQAIFMEKETIKSVILGVTRNEPLWNLDSEFGAEINNNFVNFML